MTAVSDAGAGETGTVGPTGPADTTKPAVEAKNLLDPAAAKAAQSADTPASTPASDDKGRTDPSRPEDGGQLSGGLTADEERTLADLTAKRAAAQSDIPMVRMKVEPPHQSVTHGGVTVTNEYTEVPAWFASAIASGAETAGVTITQEN
jgi:hypothetical protein